MRSVKLNGKTTGFIVEIVGRRDHYLKTSTGIRIFDNLRIAKITAHAYIKNAKFRYHIKYEDGFVSLDDTQYMGNGKYQAVTAYGEIIEIVEKRVYSSVLFKYLVFANGDTERTPKDKGIQCNRELTKLLKYCINLELLEDDPDAKVTRVKKDKGEFILYLKGTTSQIHIMSISTMMDKNQLRKKEGKIGVLPFKKEMDKFKCFYLYTCKDCSESKRLDGDDKTNKVIERILHRLDEETKEYDNIPFKSVNVDHEGYLLLEGED